VHATRPDDEEIDLLAGRRCPRLAQRRETGLASIVQKGLHRDPTGIDGGSTRAGRPQAVSSSSSVPRLWRAVRSQRS
jgi:hypothetical protein